MERPFHSAENILPNFKTKFRLTLGMIIVIKDWRRGYWECSLETDL